MAENRTTRDSGSDTRTRGTTHTQSQRKKRSVGATTIAPLRTASMGVDHPADRRARGRGQTARLVADQRSEQIKARPAVYTAPVKSRKQPLANVTLPAWAPFVLVLIALALVGIILYGPAKMFYGAWRDNGKLEARYEALTKQNEELNYEVDRLQSLSGIEDEARRRGYAFPDEEALVVDNLEVDDPTDPEKVEEAVREHERNRPFYVQVLDQFFGYGV